MAYQTRVSRPRSIHSSRRWESPSTARKAMAKGDRWVHLRELTEACEMQSAQTYLEVVRSRGERQLELQGLSSICVTGTCS